MTLPIVVIALSYKVKGTHHYDAFPKGNISLNSFINIILKPAKVCSLKTMPQIRFSSSEIAITIHKEQ